MGQEVEAFIQDCRLEKASGRPTEVASAAKGSIIVTSGKIAPPQPRPSPPPVETYEGPDDFSDIPF